jgi:hypothetical protein
MPRHVIDNSPRAASAPPPNGNITRINSNEVGDTSPTLCGKKTLWITNVGKNEAEGVVARSSKTLYVGRPCQTLSHSVRELEDVGLVGIYEEYDVERT